MNRNKSVDLPEGLKSAGMRVAGTPGSDVGIENEGQSSREGAQDDDDLMDMDKPYELRSDDDFLVDDLDEEWDEEARDALANFRNKAAYVPVIPYNVYNACHCTATQACT